MANVAETRCCWHLPGNRPCPNPPLYDVEWKLNEPRAYEKHPPEFREIRRSVCVFHLVPAIDAAIEAAPFSVGAVSVSFGAWV